MSISGGASTSERRKALRSSPWVPWFVLGVSLLGTALATSSARQAAWSKDQERFTNAVERATDTINDRIDAYMTVLKGTAAYFNTIPGGRVSKAGFKNYIAHLNLFQEFPGFHGIGATVRLRPGELEILKREAEKQGVTRLDPLNPDPQKPIPFDRWPDEKDFDEQHAIVFLEPLTPSNHAAIGFDMYTEAVRREAMSRARDTGQPALSGKVRLVQELKKEGQAGFLFYVPMYEGRVVPKSLEERRARLRGFVYAPFRADDLFHGLFGSERYPRLHFQVYDGEAPREQSLLHSSERASVNESGYTPRFLDSQRLVIAGRPWTVTFATRPEFELSSTAGWVPVVALCGIVLSGVLFSATRSQAQARIAAEDHAEEIARSEQALRGSEAELRRLVAREQVARREAERASRLKDEFLANVSHELRTPLNAILGWSQLLKLGANEEATLRQGLDTIERNARSQAQLIEDLLDVSRIVSGTLRLDVKEVDLPAVVAAAADTVRPAAEAKRIEIVINESAGSGLQTLPMRGDATRLQQVVWNLLSNAVKFTPAGGRVEVTLETTSDLAEIRVSDTGEGIAEEFLPYVFTRFMQADSSTTRRHGGLGLGLAIVRHLVELHGGTIDAQSQGKGHGSTFIVHLPAGGVNRVQEGDGSGDVSPEAPAAPAPLTAASADSDPSSDGGESLDLKGVRVLVVDDEADAREVISRILKLSHAEILLASSLDEAMEIVSRERVDVLLSDISMPGGDGYELIRQVRALPPEQGGQVPAIALTALARAEDRVRALETGYQLHVAKPVEAEELRAVVRRIVRPEADAPARGSFPEILPGRVE